MRGSRDWSTRCRVRGKKEVLRAGVGLQVPASEALDLPKLPHCTRLPGIVKDKLPKTFSRSTYRRLS